MREAYPYLDDTATVIRPHGLREVNAIRLLRTRCVLPKFGASSNAYLTGHLSQLEASDAVLLQGPPVFREAVNRMMEHDWIRTPEQWTELNENIWTRNEAMLARLLRGM